MRSIKTFRSSWSWLLLFLTAAATQLAARAQAPPAPQVTRQDATNDMALIVGRSVLLDCAQPVQRVAVGSPTVADATPISPLEVMVNGKAPGETTLILWEKGGSREFFNITVRAGTADTNDRVDSVRRELRNELPGQPLKVSFENGNVFLRGTVDSLTDSARAVQIASAGGKVVNLLDVKVPSATPQILLKVIFASVDRTREKQLGINLFSTGYGNTMGGVTTGQYSPPTIGTVPGPAGATLSNELNLFAFFPGLNLGATIQAMEQRGLVQVLAEPNVLTEDGKLGTFLAGGEYPYPVVQGSSVGGAGPTVTIMFKDFGVRLNFIPTITPRGTVHLQVAPEVSSLDFSNAVTISGFQIPAIAMRRVNTEVELSPGQSFAIGGLLDNRVTDTFTKIPFIGDIPILGKFFQSVNRTKSNTELIVIVTPEIVQPVPSGSIPTPKYPMAFMPPNSRTPMHTPEAGTASAAAKPATMPVEQLIESMKAEKPLPDTGSGYSSGGGGSSGP
ncbi:MAG TPA: pilus assembly protein N-terminal domain-containing protein [Terracidiphilus sp.]|nr:pilus assembly protein N-terminal domain-containing protein [Terracidiphilus sp.]